MKDALLTAGLGIMRALLGVLFVVLRELSLPMLDAL